MNPSKIRSAKIRSLVRTLYDAQGGVCPRCARHMNPPHLFSHRAADAGLSATIDHVTPKARGGVDCISNMVAMCSACNNSKGNTAPTGCDHIWLAGTAARVGMDPFQSPISEYHPPELRMATLGDFWPMG